MRITDIEIKNFRAFRGTYHIELPTAGQNLLVYGENGSGKSSLYLALKLFLESGEGAHQFEKHQNVFIEDKGYIKLGLQGNSQSGQNTYEWSESVKDETTNPVVIAASKAKGFLDYKDLLETHYVHRQQEKVNVFELLVGTLLVNTIHHLTGQSLGSEWEAIQQTPLPRRNATGRIRQLENR